MKQRKHTTSRFGHLLDSYNLLLVAYLILRLIGGSRWWWLGLLNTFAFWLFVPLLMVVALAVIARQQRIAMNAIILFVFGMLQFAPVSIGAFSQSEEPHDLRVLTFNLLGANQQMPRAIDWVLVQDADVIILQELEGRNQQEQLPRLLEYYPHHVSVAGNVRILSREPFLESGIIFLEDPSAYRDGRQAVRAVIDHDGQPVTIYGVHLDVPTGDNAHGNLVTGIGTLDFILRYDEAIRNGQIDNLALRVTNETNPVIVAGDFNTSHTSPVIEQLHKAGLVDAFHAAGRGWGLTWATVPDSFAVLRLDYVWSSTGIRPLRFSRNDRNGSDHHPLIVDFVLEDKSH